MPNGLRGRRPGFSPCRTSSPRRSRACAVVLRGSSSSPNRTRTTAARTATSSTRTSTPTPRQPRTSGDGSWTCPWRSIVPADPGRRTSVALAGGGIRATSHTSRILRAGGRVTAVSEPIRARQDHVVDRHRAADPDTPPPRRFPEWESMARHSERHGRLADAVLVATQDADHADAVERFAALGYDILCEKPMGATDDQAVRIVEAATRADVLFAVCHTLRYTTYTRELRTLLATGRIGSIVSVQHLEP